MITNDTALKLAYAYREVEVAEKLLGEVRDYMTKRAAPDIRDAFGRHVDGLELGIPSGDNGRRLFRLPWSLAVPVIEAHIANQRAIIAALSETARLELEAAR